MLHDLFTFPPEVQDLSYSRVDSSIRHHQDNVILFKIKFRFIYCLAAYLQLLSFEVDTFSFMIIYRLRVIELIEEAFAFIVGMYQGECGISDASHLAYGESLDESLNAFVYVDAVGCHRAQYLGCKCREYVGFHSAAKSVGKHQGSIIAIDYAHYIIAAQFFAELIHRGTSIFQA